MTKLSSSATRLITIALPSMANNSPASTARVFERNSSFATSMSSTTARMPVTAVAMRQPTGLSGPSRLMPSPMIHLPSGGCTTNDAAVE